MRPFFQAYACVGILVNLMSDQEHRPLFKEASGVLRCIEVLVIKQTLTFKLLVYSFIQSSWHQIEIALILFGPSILLTYRK